MTRQLKRKIDNGVSYPTYERSQMYECIISQTKFIDNIHRWNLKVGLLFLVGFVVWSLTTVFGFFGDSWGSDAIVERCRYCSTKSVHDLRTIIDITLNVVLSSVETTTISEGLMTELRITSIFYLRTSTPGSNEIWWQTKEVTFQMYFF